MLGEISLLTSHQASCMYSLAWRCTLHITPGFGTTASFRYLPKHHGHQFLIHNGHRGARATMELELFSLTNWGVGFKLEVV